MITSRSFSSDPASTRSARHFVLHAVGQAPPGVRDAIAVMIGELAMNAVQHAQTGFGVTVELAGGTLRVEVTDSGGNYPAPGPMPPPSSSRGRGLPIVDSLADTWGITWSPPAPGKTVWFEIAVPPGSEPEPGTAAGLGGASPPHLPRAGAGRRIVDTYPPLEGG
jgi:anti-sigma regulatory factor (Ser/Thr protein kinase)